MAAKQVTAKSSLSKKVSKSVSKTVSKSTAKSDTKSETDAVNNINNDERSAKQWFVLMCRPIREKKWII